MEVRMRTLWTLLLISIFITHSLALIKVSYTLVEDKGPGIKLGILADDAELASKLQDPMGLEDLRYSFLSQNHPHTFRFSVDEITSELRTKYNIDRDEICKYSPDYCQISLEVAAQAYIGTFFEKIAITVNIEDINDHSPRFNKSIVHLAISESSLVGSKFTIDNAFDEDSKNFSVKSYRVEPASSPFGTEVTKSLDDSLEVKLVVKEELDREKNDHYQINVIAEDGGSPPRTGKLDVNVTITDVNDNAPVFSKPLYNITVMEDIAKDTVILQVNATDNDMGKNGEVTYKISANQPKEVQDIFSINEITGELRVVKHLLYEPREMYKLIVEAYDKGNQPSRTQIYVFVHVQDTGNNPPEISINLLLGTNVAKISEYAVMGTPVAHVVVTDPDTGHNSLVTCNITSSEEYFKLQRLDVNEYKVIVQKPLDRETLQEHHVSVFCTDVGNPPLNSTKNFIAEVLDENDLAPVFTKPVYVKSFDENNNPGEVIIQVVAIDGDVGDNARVQYALHQEAMPYFSIGNFTGIITANRAFDREKKSQYKFHVYAVDKGEPPKSSTTTVTINIADRNDNVPQFTQASYTVSVKENLKIDSNVTRVYAKDLDVGNNAVITFSLDPNSFGVPFIVMPNGIIRTTIKLDREAVNQYKFTVIASDHGNPSLKSSARVTVNIGDENDNAPVITYPNVSNYTVKVPYNTRLNTIVAVVQAFDKDIGINSRLVYSITTRNDSDIFNINSRTGEVIVAKQMQKKHISKYFIKIAVSDQGIHHQTSTTKLNLIVTEKNTTSITTVGDDEESQYNIAIVVTVVVVTLVLSATILVTIFIIRHLDRQKRKYAQSGLVIDGAKVKNEKVLNQPTSSTMSDGKGPLYSPVGENVGILNSYATEHSLDRMSMSSHNTFQVSHSTYDRHCSENVENSERSLRCDTPGDDIKQSELHRLASLRIHQALTQSQDKSFGSQHSVIPYGKEVKRSTEDHNSDTSGDTIPSDSGRGTSEDEVPSISQSHNSEDFRKYQIQQYGHRGDMPPPYRNNYQEQNHYMNMSRTPPSKLPSISSGVISPRLHDELKLHLQPNIHMSLQRQQKVSLSSTSSDVPSYGNFQRGLVIPPVDETLDSVATGYDDDDNTTTSGSYTIDNEDFSMELHLKSVHDVFV